MKELTALIIAAVVFVSGLFYFMDRTGLSNANAAVQDSATKVYRKYGEKIAYKSYELCRGYFPELLQGKFLGRLEMAQRTANQGESYEQIVGDMIPMLESYATQKTDWSSVQGVDKFTYLNEATPRGKILEMMSLLNELSMFKYKDLPWSEVVVYRKKVDEIQKKLDQILAR